MLKRPNLKSVKDPEVLAYIDALEKYSEEYHKIKNKGAFKAYMVIHDQINSFSDQLTIRKERCPNPENPNEMIDVEFGKIDLFADKDQKEFDRAWKFLMEAADLLEGQDRLFKLLTEDEQKEVKKVLKNSSAERHVFSEK